MISSDGITRDISSEEAVPWQPQNLNELASGATPTLEEKLAMATKTGYRQGYNEALAESGKKEAIQIARINELLRYLGQPLASVDETLKQSMLSLAAEMASHIVGREIGSDLDYYRIQLDQLSDKLPAQVRVTSLRLRPEKARELREMRDAADGDTDALPEIVDDTELAGDVCLACWQESAVDISAHGRLASIVQSYCGDNTSEALAVEIQPVTDTPVGDAPGPDTPVIDQPVADQPADDAPAHDEPSSDVTPVDTTVAADPQSSEQAANQPSGGVAVDVSEPTQLSSDSQPRGSVNPPVDAVDNDVK